jgi:Tol biopolymer transport system component
MPRSPRLLACFAILIAAVVVAAGDASGAAPDAGLADATRGGTIWLMRSNGSGQRQLSEPGAADPRTGPRWSPSGSMLAFEGKGEIYVINGDGTSLRKLVPGGRPAWSPDGTRLAFVRANELWTVNQDGSGERRLTSDELETTSRPDWSPDGNSLVVARAGDIYEVDAATGAERDLTPGNRPESDPVWSRDGSRIAFARGYLSNNCCGGSIYIVRPDGSGLRGSAKARPRTPSTRRLPGRRTAPGSPT